MANDEVIQSFRDDPIKWCNQKYEKFLTYNESVRSQITDDWNFYNGHDEELETRRASSKVKRAAYYVPEIRPSAETAIAAVVNAVTETNTPVRIIPDVDEQKVDQKLLSTLEQRLDRDLRDSGLLMTGFQQAMEAVVYSPVIAAKMSWSLEYGWVYKKKNVVVQGLAAILSIFGGEIETVKREWDVVYNGPVVDMLDHDELLYDPTVADIQQSDIVIHAQYLTLDQIKDNDEYDEAQIAKLEEDWRGYMAQHSGGTATVKDDIAAKEEPGRQPSYRDDRILVAECWVWDADKDGNELTRIYTVAAQKYPLEREKYGRETPWPNVRFPFPVIRLNRYYNRVEGLPPVRIAKVCQKIYSDCFNAMMDYQSYNSWTVFKNGAGNQIVGEPPVWGPGTIINMTKPELFEPIMTPDQDVTTIMPLSEAMKDKIRQIFNTSDISQGIQGQAAELATKTMERQKGTAQRQRRWMLPAAEFICDIASLIIRMRVAMGDAEWAFKLKVDVPSLTGQRSAEEEIQQTMLMIEKAETSPLYATPQGMLKIRELYARLYDLLKIRDIDRYLPTAEEITQGIQDAADQAVMMPGEEGGEPATQTGQEGIPNVS